MLGTDWTGAEVIVPPGTSGAPVVAFAGMLLTGCEVIVPPGVNDGEESPTAIAVPANPPISTAHAPAAIPLLTAPHTTPPQLLSQSFLMIPSSRWFGFRCIYVYSS